MVVTDVEVVVVVTIDVVGSVVVSEKGFEGLASMGPGGGLGLKNGGLPNSPRMSSGLTATSSFPSSSPFPKTPSSSSFPPPKIQGGTVGMCIPSPPWFGPSLSYSSSSLLTPPPPRSSLSSPSGA